MVSTGERRDNQGNEDDEDKQDQASRKNRREQIHATIDRNDNVDTGQV